MIMEQDRLFEVEDFNEVAQRDALVPVLENFLAEITLKLDNQDSTRQEYWPFVRLELKRTSIKDNATGTYYDGFNSKKQFIPHLSGFIEPNPANEDDERTSPPLLLWQNIADSVMNVHVELNCISSISVYSEEYAEIITARDNAYMDGSVRGYVDSNDNSTHTVLRPHELDYYAFHPPKPIATLTF